MPTYTLDQLDGFPWIVSVDTLRTEDLLVRFWQTAEQLHRLAYSGHPFAAQHPALVRELELLAGEDAKEQDWNEERARQCVDDLAEYLQDYAPSGFHFGASAGDGAAFGFWLSDEWVDALEHCGWAADSDPAALADVIRELEDDGIDCENYEDAYAGSAEGCTEDKAGEDFAQAFADELGLPAKLDGTSWPIYCIDWAYAWRELVAGDGYRLHRISGNDWAVFRAV